MGEKEKKVFKIQVGNIPEDEIEDYIKKVVEKFKKTESGLDEDFSGNIEYFTKKRDDLLERLNRYITTNENEEMVQSALRSVLITQMQLKLMEDAQIVYRVSKANNEK